ncbi:MAG: hypothetical protein ACMXYC_00315 [Candidatus Woesearchaeota archaeon]
MELHITTTTKQPDLYRQYLTGHILYPEGTTPARLQVQEAVAKKLQVDKDVVLVRVINPVFGHAKSTIEVYVYETAEALKRYETTNMQNRHVVKKKEE